MLVSKHGLSILFAISIILTYFSTSTSAYHLNSTQNRIRRQSSCGSTQFRCDNGQCVSQYSFCDGTADCADGSDEDLKCNTYSCREDTFRCAYGGCVDGDARCNGKKECHDNSDEQGCANQTTNKCGNGFTCANGQCINQYLLCDGSKDCNDGSDETFAACKDIPCQSTSYRCAYGGCVDGDAKCNKIQECADGSDESPKICPNVPEPVTPTPAQGCVLPSIFENGRFIVPGQYISGQVFPDFTLITFECDTNYGLRPAIQFVGCLQGKWNNEFPKCVRVCSPRVSESVETTCELDGIKQDCSRPMVEGTLVYMKCKHLYNQLDSSSNPSSVCQGGSWDVPFIRCVPECGQVIPKGTPLIVNGVAAKKGDFPWHIAIYRKSTQDSSFQYKCGGSIVNPKVVLTAAHCFTADEDGKLFNIGEFRIAAGKYYSDYDAADDTAFVQKREIKEVHIPRDYKAFLSSYAADIALVIVIKPFVISNVVQPVCVDWNKNYEDEQLIAANTGVVVGWGFTSEGRQQAHELKQLTVPYIDRGMCIDIVPQDFIRFVTTDKFCAGFTNGSSVCNGDSGGGLVFYRTQDRKYYIRGLVSVGPLKEGTCDSHQYGAYTKISQYMDFIRRTEIINRVDSN